jgi:hypothetical protein
MTPRLNQLAEEAWDATAVSPDFGHPVSFVEKFAQMIIHECIHAVEKHNAQAYQVSDPKNISQIIQDHFKE